MRNHRLAGTTPGRPNVKDNNLALECREAALAAAREADFEAQDRIADARRPTKEWDSYEAQYKYVYGDCWVPPKEERDDYEAVMKATYGDKWIPRWPQVDIEEVADDEVELEKQEL